jgi:hypothetical protein
LINCPDLINGLRRLLRICVAERGVSADFPDEWAPESRIRPGFRVVAVDLCGPASADGVAH